MNYSYLKRLERLPSFDKLRASLAEHFPRFLVKAPQSDAFGSGFSNFTRFVACFNLLFLLLPTSGVAQQYNFRTYSIEDGLAQSQVSSMCQDSKGYLWFVTLGGVSKFDGIKFTNYTKEDGLVNNVVNTVFKDQEGNLWFGTDRGVSKFNGTTFSNFTEKEGLSNNRVRAILQTRDGNLWFGTDDGLNKLDGDSFTHFKEKDGLSNKTILALIEDQQGQIWIGTQHGLSKFNGKTLSSLTENDRLCNSQINAILEDRDGAFWFGTNKGVSKLEGTTYSNFTKKDGLIDNTIYAISQDHTGNIWFGTDNGVQKFDGKTFSSFTTKNGLSSNKIQSILEDRDGNLWFGTNGGGVTKFAGETFTHFPKLGGVWCILEDRNGNFWFGTDEGVSKYDGEIFKTFTEKDGLIHKTVTTIFEDRAGNLWFGTDNGLSKLAPSPNSEFNKENLVNFSKRDGLVNNKIYAIFQDREDNLWFGTNGGVSQFNGQTFTNFTVENGLLNNRVNSILQDKKGGFWFGTEGGVNKFDGHAMTHFPLKDSLNTILVSIVEDQHGHLWFGTYGGGVTRYDPESVDKPFDMFTSKDGLIDNEVLLLAFDNDSNLWIGTNKGINKLDVARYNKTGEKNIKHFGKEEGFVGIECSANGVYKDNEGNLWFGTVKGATKYNSRASKTSSKEPLTDISKIRLSFQNVKWSGLDHLIDDRTGLPLDLNLPYDENHVTFDFIGISLSNPEKVYYKYMLEGFDENWSPAAKERFATYSNLPAGEYTFKVKASNAEGVWNENPKSFSFSIEPPFWQTWWFYTLGLITFWGGLYLIVKQRIKSLQKLRRQLEETVNERTAELEQQNLKLQTILTERAQAEKALRESEKRTRLLQEVATAANEAASPHAAFQVILNRVCEYTKWPVGHVYVLAENNPSELVPAKIWYIESPETFKVFKKITEQTTFEMGIGLPGRVLKSKKPVWIRDVTKDKNCTRAKLGEYIDLRGAFGFPVIVENKVAAVLEFFTREVKAPDDTLLETMAQIGIQLGNVIERQRAEERLVNNEQELSAANQQLNAGLEQLKAQERFTRENERKYRNLFNQIVDPIFIFDKTTFKFLDCNEAVLWTYGYSKTEMMKMTPLELHPESHQKKIRKKLGKVNIGKAHPYIHVTKNGERIDVEILTSEIEYQGEPAWISTARNVTERKRAEKVRHQSEKRFRDLFQNSPDAIFVKDLNGNILDVNNAACKLHELSHDELVGKNLVDLVPERNRKKMTTGWADVVSGEKAYSEGISLTQSGREIPVEIKTTQINYLDKPALLFHVRDISDRKQTEAELKSLNEKLINHQKELSAANQQLTASYEQLKANEIALIESEEQIRLIIDSAQDAVITMDEGGLIKDWNVQAEQIFGWSRQDILQQPLAEKIIAENYRGEFIRGLNLFSERGTGPFFNQRFEMQARHYDGHEFQVEITITPLKIGNSFLFSAFIRDITEQKRSEYELKTAKETAENANKELRRTNQHLERATLLAKEMAMQAEMASGAKSEFLANMSHEIRTPLNAIIGMTDLALETELTFDQRQFLSVVQSSSEGLLSLINDILDFSKIEAGQMQLEQIEFNLREVIEGVAEMLGTRAQAKEIEFLCYVEPDLPTTVIGDPTRLRQVLLNLIGNAIKFTEEGQVAIKVESAAGENARWEEGFVELHFKVSDSGIGISSENITKIFEKFSQEDTSTTRKFGGTGLGLNISTSLIEMMAGELKVESEEGKGSTFHFKLRLPVGQNKTDGLEKIYSEFKNLNVLVVDDNQTNRFILRKYLEKWGFQVTEAQTSQQALAILAAANPPITLAILDQTMPEMDGLNLARRIRENETIKETKLILLSSLVRFDREIQQQLQIAESIVKPVKQSQLFDSILRALTDKDPGEQLNQDKKITVVHENKIAGNILLVEDNLSNQKLTKKILEKRGYRVDIAENGLLGVEAFIKYRYDLILMDIYMPEMDGFEATHEIRSWERQHNEDRIPIVALTAHAIDGYREKCLQNGMNDYVTKPIKKKILYNVIEHWLDARPSILIVDDSKDNRNLLLHNLKRKGEYQLITANNGEEAVNIFKRRPISIILMDMEMPVMDGREATRKIRSLENGEDVPVIALTAHHGKNEQDKCLEAGANKFLTKPIRKQKLFETIEEYLKNEPVLAES